MTDLEKDVVALFERVGALEAVVRDHSRALRARVAEREKTETSGSRPAAVPTAGPSAGDGADKVPEKHTDGGSREQTGTSSEGATPAPCPTCGGDGEIVNANPDLLPFACPKCRAPASSPAPAAPEACPCGSTLPRARCHPIKAPEARGDEDENPDSIVALVDADIHMITVGGVLLELRTCRNGASALVTQLRGILRAERVRARDAALEEAARACDAIAEREREKIGEVHTITPYDRNRWTALECAERIRALRGKAESGEGGE